MNTTILSLIYIVIGYLVGSVCSAVIVCRLFGYPDPRTAGSNNPGATNVLRLAGKECAIIVLIADMLKGLLPVLLANICGANTITLAFVALACVLGHMFPIFFKFKGGKGVATALGAIIGLNWLLGAMVVGTWLIIARLTHYSSLASILTLTAAPFYSLLVIGNVNAFLPLMIITLFVLYKHHENILRLMDKKEPKIKVEKVKTPKVTKTKSKK